ncbi:GAF domain-containing protein [Crocinitomicaceae bacterium]|nr:GAF domain-containing protein [Crocinitomicaceae bacterium]
MAEDLVLIEGDKSTKYEGLIPQIKALIGDEKDGVANQANVAAALKEAFGFLWVGFYNVKEDELVLGPFQGPVACTRIQFGKGVCGTAWERKDTVIVDDVEQFPGHIFCSSSSKSEIVVPLVKECQVVAVLDVDSDQLGNFDGVDSIYLNQICEWLVSIM